MLNLVRNLQILIHEKVPETSRPFFLLSLLKKNSGHHTSHVVYKKTYQVLDVLITDYLKFLNSLFPNSLKPKHHILVHYPQIMKKVGSLWKISSMRSEGKHREGKIVSGSTITRVNICRTISIRHQLMLNFRFMVKKSTDICKFGTGSAFNLRSLPYFVKIKHFFSKTMTLEMNVVKWFEINGFKIQFDSVFVVMKEIPEFYIVDKIILDSRNNVHVTAKKINDVYLREHSQSFVTTYSNKNFEWQVLNLNDLSQAVKTVKNKDKKGNIHITKNWL